MDLFKSGWFTELSPDATTENLAESVAGPKNAPDGSINLGWRGQAFSLKVDQVLYHEKSEYQDILIFKSSTYGTVLVLDGVIQCTERDEFSYQEMLAHLPLAINPSAKQVLVIGGGDGGIVREVLKHSNVESIVLCEIDEKVVEACKKYLPSMAGCFGHSKVTVHIGDGLEFMKKNKKRFDVIITDSSDPIGPAETLFTDSYYHLVNEALSENGVLSSQAESMWLHLDMIKRLVGFCRKIFPSVGYAYSSVPTYPSGVIGYLICSKVKDCPLNQPKFCFDAKQLADVKMRFYSAEMHKASFVLPFFVQKIAGKYLSLYEGFYKEVDPHFKGIIKAQVAASFLKRSNLPNVVLGKIWEIADKNSQGFLDKPGFFIALKLIACAQNEVELSVSNLTAELSPPVVASQAESPSLPAFGSVVTPDPSNEWALKPKELIKYDEIFQSLGPVDGKLTGDQVKPVLLNSGLPFDLLGKIWELSDIDKDGFLDRDEMCVALHLVYRALENEPVPIVLPQILVPPAKRRSSSVISQQGRKITLPGAVKVLPPQASLSRRSRASSVTSMESVGLPAGPHSPGMATRSLSGTPIPNTTVRPPAPWIVDKYKFEAIFNEADQDADGLVSGPDVRRIFLLTGLAQAYLAHIWNLCDIKSTGSLNLEQFALAMFFVEQKRLHNVEPPAELPPDLVPPSFRPNPAGMTDIATNTSQDSSEITPSVKTSGNKEIDQVLSEIALLQREKRESEHDVIQLEADITVKQSEIRNFEVELNTLNATFKQLERQKGEAGRRLDDLENQRISILSTLEDLKGKNEDDRADITELKFNIENAAIVMQKQEQEFVEKRKELEKMNEEERKLKCQLKSQQSMLQEMNQQQISAEQSVEDSNRTVKLLRDQRVDLVEKLAKLEAALNLENNADFLAIDPNLLKADEEETFNTILGIKRIIPPVDHIQHDPFKAVDPFACGAEDPFANVDPFSSNAHIEDPFASAADPFASKSFGFPPASGGPAKKAPPRPAPPGGPRPTKVVGQLSSPNAASRDPFGGQSAAVNVEDPFGGTANRADSGGFANFADFSQFS